MPSAKLISLAIPSVLISFWLGYFSFLYCTDTKFIFDLFESLRVLGLISLAASVVAIMSGVYLMLNENKTERTIFSAINGLGFTLGILAALNFNLLASNIYLILAISLITIFAGFYNFDTHIGNTYRNLIKANFFGPISNSARSLFIFLSLIIALNFYFINYATERQNQLIDESINIMLDPITNQSQNYLNDQLSQYTDIASSFNVDLSGSMQMMGDVAKKQVKDAIEPYRPNILIIFALLVFLSVYTTLKLVSIIIYPLSWALYLILKTAGFINEKTETVEITRFSI